ncbi:MAG: class I SAM-dependent DNA methyltransferase [Parasphingopyxis sp.]|uniref:class I SAM-dependent DNA methyltransferase n=1 Tax=Parasphingopyxis sp. TaxID=1920299 RepID=UPI003FA0C607
MPAQSFWDRIAPRYARKPVDDPSAYEQKLLSVGSLLRAQDRVLEIGCGTGTTALRLAPGVARYTATDSSRAMVEIAEGKLGPKTPENVTFLQADACEQVCGAPFDAICAFSLLHLVDDVPTVLAAVHAQLKPGGLFLSKTVCLREASPSIRFLVLTLTALRLAPRVTPLSRADLLRQFAEAGFEVERTTHFGKKSMSPFIVARKSTA